MRQFRDRLGTVWTMTLTIGAAMRVRDLLGVNLLELERGDPPLLTCLGSDPILLVDVIYAICRPEADSRQIDDRTFGELLGGEAVLAAQTAFYEEAVDFFRSLGRTDLAKAIDAQRRVIDLAIRRAETQIEQLDLAAAVAATFGGPSTSWPASSASTPPP